MERNPASWSGLKRTSLESHSPGLSISMATVACTSPAGQDLFHPGKKTGPLLACIPNMETGAKGGDGTPPGRPSFPVSEGELAALVLQQRARASHLGASICCKGHRKGSQSCRDPKTPLASVGFYFALFHFYSANPARLGKRSTTVLFSRAYFVLE